MNLFENSQIQKYKWKPESSQKGITNIEMKDKIKMRPPPRFLEGGAVILWALYMVSELMSSILTDCSIIIFL